MKLDNTNILPALQQLQIRLQSIHNAISNFQPSTSKPPVLDSSLDVGSDSSEDAQWLQQEHIPGLKKLRDSVKIDLDVLDKFLDDPESAHLAPPSTNAPYLIAVWNEVLFASASIDSVFKLMPLAAADNPDPRQRGTPRPAAAKVDVVADDGRRWIRVNTVKNARLLAEFREIDSYLTDSEDEAYEESEDARPTLAQRVFDNSLLKMGRSLLAAAKANPIEGTTEVPRVTLRLTRLDPSPNHGEDNDPRILQTMQCLQDMGIETELGERRPEELPAPVTATPPSAPPTPLDPTTNINLDLSVLIALISDLTHAPLPKTAEETNARFIPPHAYLEWKKKKNGLYEKRKTKAKAIATESLDPEGVDVDPGDIPSDLAKHSRALTNQLLQEMGKGLLQEIHDKISVLDRGATQLKFWTTIEARDRCLRIISKIGGPSEKRRAHAIFHSVSSILPEVLLPDQAEEAYWQNSRYPFQFLPLFPINLFPSSLEPDVTLNLRSPTLPQFSKVLGKTCGDILAQEITPRICSLPKAVIDNRSQPDLGGEIQRATVTKANPRLTAHTVQSLLWGAELGWTTLTANKTSIRAILREIKLAKITRRLDGLFQDDDVTKTENNDKAAIWIVDPRSLAEGMSSRAA